MDVKADRDAVSIQLSRDEAKLLRLALERASFIDTPVAEQARIQEFCARVLEALGPSQR
jgi:hypothetical protein